MLVLIIIPCYYEFMDLRYCKMDMGSPFGGEIFYIEETGSTMDDARLFIDQTKTPGSSETISKYLDGTVFWAGYQKAGRGRVAGRRWLAAAGENLMFTILISKSSIASPFTAFPLIVGLAAAKTLEPLGVQAAIKWPNDLLVGDKKISGILCETRGNYLSAGMGMNILQTDFDSGLESKATSLALEIKTPLRPREVLESFLENFSNQLESKDWRADVESRLYQLGSSLEVEMGLPDGSGRRCKGVVKGIGSAGELLLEDKGKLFSVFSGEVILPGGYKV